MNAHQLSAGQTLIGDLEEYSTRYTRWVEQLAGRARTPADASLVAALDDVGTSLSRAQDGLEAALGAQAPGQRLGRRMSRMDALTLWPEYIPAFPLLGKRIENRPWWRCSLAGRLLALHGGLQWGGSGRRTAKPVAIDAVMRHGRRAGCSDEQLRAYQLAALGLAEGWPGDGRGHIKVVVRVAGAVQPAELEVHPPWMFPSSPWAWLIDQVYELPEAIPVPRRGFHRGLWRLPKVLVEQIYAQLPFLAETS